jgi:serine/threonine protein kinase/tetratricopeptide (TPR) repeat protein
MRGRRGIFARSRAFACFGRFATSFLEKSAIELGGEHFGADTTANAELDSEQIGRRIGAYRIERELGRGGMGTVYLAVRADDQYQKQVAIKLIKRGMDTDYVLRRFRTERQILAGLEHPNIARLLDGGTTDDGLPFFVMEHVEGKSITDYADHHRLSALERLKMFRIVCKAVHYAHQHLVIHRDLKPSNILVTEDGTPKLLDFGIAKLLAAQPHEDGAWAQETATGMAMMTPEYASPEQVRGASVTTASDVYSLGVVLYELLTGHQPFHFSSRRPDEVARMICGTEPERPSTAIGRTHDIQRTQDGKNGAFGTGAAAAESMAARFGETRDGNSVERLRRLLRGDIDTIVLTAMHKEPQRRYASVERLSEDIRRHLEGLPVEARRDAFGYRAGKFVRRNRLGVSAAALVLLSLFVGIGATTYHWSVAARERRLAQNRFNEVRQLANNIVFKYYDQIKDLAGATKAREMLVTDATAYLDRLAKDAGDDASLQLELAKAYTRIGDVQGAAYEANTGDTAGAIASYRNALNLLENLSQKTPDDLEVMKQRRGTHNRLGLVLVRAGDTEDARASYRSAVALSEQILTREPDVARQKVGLAQSYVNLCRALPPGLGAGESVETCRRAIPILEEIINANPNELPALTEMNAAENQLGAQLTAVGDGVDRDADLARSREVYGEAAAHFRRAGVMAKRMLEIEPQNALFRRRLFAATFNESTAQRNSGDADAALITQRAMFDEATKVAAADEANAESQYDVVTVTNEIGLTHIERRDFPSAAAQFRQALAMLDKLIAQDPKSAELQRDKFETYSHLGEALATQGDFENAIAAFREAYAHAQTAPTLKDTPFVIYAEGVMHEKVGDCYFARAEKKTASAAQRRSEFQAARAEYEKTIQAWQQAGAAPENFGFSAEKISALKERLSRCVTLIAAL